MAIGAVAMAAFGYWLVRRKRQHKATLIDPDLFKSKVFRFGISEQTLQQIALGFGGADPGRSRADSGWYPLVIAGAGLGCWCRS